MGHVLQNETQGRVEKASAYVRLWHQRVHNGALDGYLNTMIDDFTGNNPSALYYFDAPQHGARSNFSDPFLTPLDLLLSLLLRLADHAVLIERLAEFFGLFQLQISLAGRFESRRISEVCRIVLGI